MALIIDESLVFNLGGDMVTDNLILMMKDIPVMRINFDALIYEVLSERHIPYQIKGKLRQYEYDPSKEGRYNATQMAIAANSCRDAMISFLSSRVLPLDRDNAKKILGLLGLEQAQSPEYRAKVALTCRAVSLQDNYWVKSEDDRVSWFEVDLRQNKLSEIVAQVALHGSSLTLQGKVHTPELTTNGAYAKCWRRENGQLYLYKKGANGDDEARIEVEVSNILDKCNVRHLKYSKAMDEKVYCCKCECMTDEDLSMLSAMDFASYCNVNGMDFGTEIMKIDKDSIYKMLIVDYLISNRDRHGQNWGFWYHCNDMEIVGCHPLFDHNNSFDRALMNDSTGGQSLFDSSKTMSELAHMAMKRTDFHFTGEIEPEDFIVKSHYHSFMSRAKELGIKTYPEGASLDRQQSKLNVKTVGT